MKDRPCVYVVHHVDTEGPLYEPIEELYDRIEFTLGIQIKIERTYENLVKLRNGEIEEYKEYENELKKIIDPDLIKFNTSWYEVENTIKKVTDQSFREKFKDSKGGFYKYSWFILDHVGFETNLRHRDMGFGNIFRRYIKILGQENLRKDGIYWHFHPVSFYKEAHISKASQIGSVDLFFQILARRLFEFKWFPRVNRAGFHSVRTISNFLLEMYIPFDASNQAIEEENDKQKDNSFGRFGNWYGAPNDWSIYNPDLYDYRKKGMLKRYCSRVLNIKTRFRNINHTEIMKAFHKAESEGVNVYLGVTDHDFRDISKEVEYFYSMLLDVWYEFKNKVDFKFATSLEAFRNVLWPDGSYKNPDNIIKTNIKFMDKNVLRLKTINGKVFGIPFFAIRTVENNYFVDELDPGYEDQEWFYTFDRLTIPLKNIYQVGIAVNDIYGNQNIHIITFDNALLEKHDSYIYTGEYYV